MKQPSAVASVSRSEAERATSNWEKCVKLATKGTTQCAQWEEGDLSFQLVAYTDGLGSTPVVISGPRGSLDASKVVIHLSGGPSDPPISFLGDTRIEALRPVYDKGFSIASIGYWGTSFRTISEPNEIKMASEDLDRTSAIMRSRCDCEPAILAESLGASILFYNMRFNGRSRQFFAIAAPMDGLGYVVHYYSKLYSRKQRSEGAKSSNLYTRTHDGGFVFKEAAFVNTFDHLSRFSKAGGDHFNPSYLSARCSRVILGENDPLSRKPNSHSTKIKILRGVGHDIYAEAAPKLKDEVSNFMGCLYK